MVSNNTNKQNGEHEYKGLSTDTKPTSCAVNSIFLELDTGLFYYFDGEEWQEMIGGGSGGGGTTVVANPSGTASEDLTKLQVGNAIYGIPSGGGIGMFKVNFTYDPEERVYTCDKTYEEIITAYNRGDIIIGYCNDYNTPSISVMPYEDDETKEIAFNFLDAYIENNYNEHAYNTLVITEDNSIIHYGNLVKSSVPNP